MTGLDKGYIPASFDLTHTLDPPAALFRGLDPLREAGPLVNVIHVGINDFPEKQFHGVPIHGTSYNSYLIRNGDEYILIDGVKVIYADEHMANIEKVGGPDALKKIKNIISLHSELDHSGSIPFMMQRCPNAKLTCTAICRRGLNKFHPFLATLPEDRVELVSASKGITFGDFTLSFLPLPLLHWPDNTAIILKHASEEKVVVFSSDAMGAHLPSPHKFIDEFLAAGGNRGQVLHELIDYHTSIVGPYLEAHLRPFLDKKFDPLASSIQAVLPAHGLGYRTEEDVKWIRESMEILASGHREPGKVFVMFSTMYGSCKVIAETIQAGLFARGLNPRIVNADESDKMEWARHSWDAEAIVVVSPTLNNRAQPSIVAALSFMDGLTFLKNKPLWIAGAAGWAPREMPQHIARILEGSGAVIKNLADPMIAVWRADAAELDRVIELCDQIADDLKKE